MAGWISSKLKVAETLLQQIDQQAAESLGKNERPRPPSDLLKTTDSVPKRADSAPSLKKYQLPKKSPTTPTTPPPPPPPLPPDTATPSKRADSGGITSASADVAIDWTELLSSPKPPPPVAPSPRSKGGRRKPVAVGPPPALEKKETVNVEKVEKVSGILSRGREAEEGGKVSNDNVAVRVDEKAIVDVRGDELSGSSSGSDGSETESGSDSEEERQRREERRKRRERFIAERMAAAAVKAIKEREDMVARLEGEKESLEKILEERAKQQAQEASELQTNMIETMEAVDLEKQKHNNTRMEAFARLAKLETSNAELASLLATTQWNLEVEVNRVSDLRQQIELKELAKEAHKWRISKMHHRLSSPSKEESLRRAELEQEILDAEYSLVCNKISKLKENAKNLEENIEMTTREMIHPTDVEVELKKRLAQLTDHLIQKQTQVEALSSEKATLVLRMETVSRLLDENDLLSDEGLAAGSSVDIEAGTWQHQAATKSVFIQDRIRSGKQQLGSVIQQLDAIFTAGAIFLRRNPMAQLWSLVYLVCLHMWVMYILMASHSQVSSDGSVHSGAVFSLENISNKSSGS